MAWISSLLYEPFGQALRASLILTAPYSGRGMSGNQLNETELVMIPKFGSPK